MLKGLAKKQIQNFLGSTDFDADIAAALREKLKCVKQDDGDTVSVTTFYGEYPIMEFEVSR